MHLEGVRKGSMTRAGLVSGTETLLQAKGVRQEGKEREEWETGGRKKEGGVDEEGETAAKR